MLFKLDLLDDGWTCSVDCDGDCAEAGPREHPMDALAEALEAVDRPLLAVRLFPSRYPPERAAEVIQRYIERREARA